MSEYKPNTSYSVGGEHNHSRYFPGSWLTGTYRRNVRGSQVEGVLTDCRAAGWRNVEAWPEAF